MSTVPDPLGSIGDYTLLEELEPAGPGRLFRARDTRHGRTVVVRLLPALPDAAATAAFIQRARTLAQFSHPNVTAVFDGGESGGQPYLVFEFVKGRSLRAELAGGPLPPRRALELTVQVADAIAEVHAAGFAPAGLGPDAMLVTEKGRARIALAPLAARGGFAAGDAPRLLELPAPEQREGQEPDERAEVFTVGGLLFEMLTGRPMGDAVLAPSALNPQVPKELDAVVLHATADQPGYRYQSLVTMAAELRSIAAMLDVREATADERVDVSRLPALVGTAVLAVTLLVVAAVVWWML